MFALVPFGGGPSSEVSDCSTQFMGMLGTSEVVVPNCWSSRRKVIRPGVHSTTAVCQAPAIGVLAQRAKALPPLAPWLKAQMPPSSSPSGKSISPQDPEARQKSQATLNPGADSILNRTAKRP